jgi:hypothetical protein
LVFDFGLVLAHGQELRHVFSLTNQTKRPIRVLSGIAQTPCCSAIQALPGRIAPAAASDVAVVFRPGQQTGPRAVRFQIKTDSDEQPIYTLVLQAQLFAEWEIVPAGGRVGSINVGRSRTENWRIVCRRSESRGLPLPETVEGCDAIKARFVGPVSVQTQPGGLVQSTREVEIELAAIPKIGTQQALLVFRWGDGQTKTHLVRWTVVPLVHLAPSGIIIAASNTPIDRAVTLSSDDRPFRITRVAGPLLSEPVRTPSDSLRTHRLSLRLNPGRAISGRATAVLIEIDHPDQPRLELTVLVTPSGRGM